MFSLQLNKRNEIKSKRRFFIECLNIISIDTQHYERVVEFFELSLGKLIVWHGIYLLILISNNQTSIPLILAEFCFLPMENYIFWEG